MYSFVFLKSKKNIGNTVIIQINSLTINLKNTFSIFMKLKINDNPNIIISKIIILANCFKKYFIIFFLNIFLYKIYGSYQNVVVNLAIAVAANTPISPQAIPNITANTIFIIEQITIVYFALLNNSVV